MVIHNEYELYLSGKSIHEVSEELDIPLSTVRFRLKKRGILRTRGEAIRLAAKKGRLGSGFRGKKRVFTEIHKERIRCGKLAYGLKHAVGYRKTSAGYIEFTCGRDKGRCQHVVIMEQAIGRSIKGSEYVHHKNSIRDDNRLSNLQLLLRRDHSSLHAKQRTITRDKKGRIKSVK